MKPHVSPEVVFGSRNPNENVIRRTGRAAIEQIAGAVNRGDLIKWDEAHRDSLYRDVEQLANSQRDRLKSALNGVKYTIADEGSYVEAYAEYDDELDGTIWTLCVPNPRNDNFSVFMISTYGLGAFRSRPAGEQWVLDYSVIDQESGDSISRADYRKESKIDMCDSIDRAIWQLLVADAAGMLIAEELPGPTPGLRAA
jgi:hypothetical protein